MSDDEGHRPGSQNSVSTKQDELHEECKKQGYRAPVYSVASDRRGGRTAWSSAVDVNGKIFHARFWYDGQYVNNAKEDVAEVALTYVRSNPGNLSAEHQVRERILEEGPHFPRRPE